METYANVKDMLAERPDDFGRAFAKGLLLASKTTPDHISKIYYRRAELNRALEDIFSRCDLLLTPQLPTVCPSSRKTCRTRYASPGVRRWGSPAWNRTCSLNK